ncbi:MAG TPA: hydrogenase 4 subunit D [Anaerolineales bacterium]
MVTFALASILLPLIGSVFTLIIPRSWVKWFSQGVGLLAMACTLTVLIDLAARGRAGYSVDVLWLGNLMVYGLVVDKVSTLISTAFIVIGLMILVYSGGYLTFKNREHPESEVKRRYYFFLLLFIGSMAGLVLSSTMLGLLAFFELTGICSWGLIGYYNDEKSLKAALKAIITTEVASIGLFIATAYFFVVTGGFRVSALAQLDDASKILVFLGILIAAWGKSAQLPFHFWLPDAMAAPTPISAYLHAASMVNAGVYILARCLLAAGQVPTIIGIVGSLMAVVTMLYGLLMYFPQKDFKRLLAYSTIAQLSYIFLALSLSIFGSNTAFNGGIAHIFNHGFAKGLFFLVAGAVGFSTGTRLLPSLKGLLKKMPLVGVSFAVAALGVTGVPPFNGFFSKFSIFAGGFEAARKEPLLLVLVVIAILDTIGSFAWLFWCFSASVPGNPSDEVTAASDIAPSMKFVLVALACLVLVSGFFAMSWLS